MRKLVLMCGAEGKAEKLDYAPRASHSEQMAIAKTHTVLGRGRVLDYNGFLLGVSGDRGECLLMLSGTKEERAFLDTWSAAEWFVRNA